MTNRTLLLTVLSGLTGLGLLLALFIAEDRKRDTSLTDRFESIKRADTQFNENLLKVRTALSPNYDELVASTGEVRQLALRARTDFRTLFGESPAFESAYVKFQHRFDEKVRLSERYKSLNSITKNSLNYLEGSEKHLTIGTQAVRDEKVLHLVAQAFGKIQFMLNQPKRQPETIRSILDELDRSLRAKGLERLTELKNFRRHVEVIDKNEGAQRELLSTILGIPTQDTLRELQTLYELQHRKQVGRIVFYRNCFLSVLFLLAIGVSAILAAQKRTIQGHLAALNSAQSQLVQSSKLSALGEMAGGVAHEINNPLTIILLEAEDLRDSLAECGSPDAMMKSVQKIEATAQRIAQIVAGLRSFCRDASRDPFETFSVLTLLDETLAFCAQRFKSHGIELRLPSDLANLSMEGRKSQLSQVLLNLLNNAHDAVADLPEKWVAVEVLITDARIRMVVTDSGQGIRPEDAKKLFQPFFTTKEVGKGTGLGLSISKGLVSAHGGSLTYNELSSHTQFVIDLPQHQGRHEAA